MAEEPGQETSSTLLLRVKQLPHNQRAWAQFVDRYSRLIYQWCRTWGLHEAEAEDVTQDVLLELTRQMRDFTYDASGSFRGWLRVVAYRCWCRFVKECTREHRGRDALSIQRLCSAEAGAQFLQTLEHEGNRELLELAIERVRARVQFHTWEAFRLTAVEGWPGAEVAQRLEMNVGTVFVARSKVQRMLKEEFHKLDAEGLRTEAPSQ
ncbi:MAG TPA: sigma-70 family RNA polymerase sigma factor [Isosphaeraceae bacterium]|nr:sigma-70 family RNA polymerase sigma factor [Isosphaeraceae bacterium]